jgi:putative component of toxin-antitoxin plasmid stabilization module
MIEVRQTETFLRWRLSLRDHKARAAIAARINRMAN